MSKKRQFHMLMGRAGPANRNGRLAAAVGATVLAWAGVTGFAVPGPAGALLAPRAPAASAPAGLNPQGAVVDPATHTLYVADGKGNAVSVIDTATCNAQLGMGCAKAVATVHLARNRSSSLGSPAPSRPRSTSTLRPTPFTRPTPTATRCR